MSNIATTIVMALWVSIPAYPADTAFNMICSGTKTTKRGHVEKSQPYAVTYRIKLDERSWCEGECEAVHEIVQLEPTYLLLQWTTGSITTSRYNRIDRGTGAHEMGDTVRPMGRPEAAMEKTWEGRCEKAPFTGFPTLKTAQ